MLINTQVFCNPTRCILVNVCLHFGRACFRAVKAESSWNILNMTTTNSSETSVTIPCTWPHIPYDLTLLLVTLFYSQNKPYFVRPTTEAIILVELGCNDLGLCDISSVTLYIPWYQLTSHKVRVFLPCLVRHT